MSEGLNLTPFLIPLATLLIGWFIGFLDSNRRTAKKIQAVEANAEIAIKEAEKKTAQANQQQAQSPQVMSQDDPGLLRLKNKGGYFVLELDGTPINSVLSPDKKKRLIELLTVIRPFLEGEPPPQAPPTPAAPQQTPIARFNQTQGKAASIVQPAAFSPVQPPPIETEDTSKPVINPDDKKVMASLSMVGQIDAVLQAHLLNTPLGRRGIRLHESPEGGVQVEVGLEKFGTIDDVTDQEVKAAIRAAIAEWEKKFTPGL